MSNEEQILKMLETLATTVGNIKSDIIEIKDGQKRIEQKIDSIYDQTADLTEFRTETKDVLDGVSKDIKFVKHKVQETEEDVFTIQSHLKIIK